MKKRKQKVLKLTSFLFVVIFCLVEVGFGFDSALMRQNLSSKVPSKLPKLKSVSQISIDHEQLFQEALELLIALGQEHFEEEIEAGQFAPFQWEDLEHIPLDLLIDLAINIFARDDRYTVFEPMTLQGAYLSRFLERMPAERQHQIEEAENLLFGGFSFYDLISRAQLLGSRLLGQTNEGYHEKYVIKFAKAFAAYYFNNPDKSIYEGLMITREIEDRGVDVLDVGSGLFGIHHIRNWQENHTLVLVDNNLFITEMLREFVRLSGKQNIEVVHTDILDYVPERRFPHIQMSYTLHHLFRAEGPKPERRNLARLLFFRKAFSLLEEGGVLQIADRTDEFGDLLNRNFQGNFIQFVSERGEIIGKGLIGTPDFQKNFRVLAHLIQALEEEGFKITIDQIRAVRDSRSQAGPSKHFFGFSLTSKKVFSKNTIFVYRSA